MKTPMMKCGHAANSRNVKTGQPACVICWPSPEAGEIDTEYTEKPGRKARCAYYNTTPHGRNHESNYDCKRGEKCLCEVDSSTDLPFFESKPDKEFDVFYCGCWGWD